MQLIRHANPNHIPNNIDYWFRNFFRDLGSFGSSDNNSSLNADLHESGEAFHATFALPGVSRDDVDIELDNSVLTVSGKVLKESGSERSETTFNRSLTVPDGVTTDGITASMRDGLLTVTMPKSEDKKPVSITVN